MSNNSGCNCCGVSGRGFRVCDTRSVTIANNLYAEALFTHPFQNTGCGCGIDENDPAVCEIATRYAYAKLTVVAADAVQWNGGVVGDGGQDDVGGTIISEFILDSQEVLGKIIEYSVCPPCESFDQICPSILEHRHISDKLVANGIVGELTVNRDCRGSENLAGGGCLCNWDDGCEGDFGPEYVGNLSQGSCTYNTQCVVDDAETEPQYVTQTYEDEIDLANLPYEDLLVKLNDEAFPEDWKIRVCSMDSVFRWPVCGGDFVAISTVLENSCNYISKSTGSFEKKQIRFRFQTPSSCYIKIWVCTFTVIRTYKNGELQDCVLSNSTVTSEVLTVPNIAGKCFNGFKDATDQNGSNIVSSVITLTPWEPLEAAEGVEEPKPELVWPEDPPPPVFDPSLGYAPASTTQRIATYGAALIGISYIDGWECPLLRYSSEVWKNRASLSFATLEDLCPYFTVRALATGEINPYWTMTPTEQIAYYDYFNEFLNVNPVP